MSENWQNAIILVIVVAALAVIVGKVWDQIAERHANRKGFYGPVGARGPQGPPGECQCGPATLRALAEVTEVVILAGKKIESLAEPREGARQ